MELEIPSTICRALVSTITGAETRDPLSSHSWSLWAVVADSLSAHGQCSQAKHMFAEKACLLESLSGDGKWHCGKGRTVLA